eukprot:sb/3467191/
MSPYPKETSPYPKEKSPYPKENSPYPKENSPYPKEKSPYPKEKCPYLKEKCPYPKEKFPYPKEKSSYPKEKSPYPKEILYNSTHCNPPFSLQVMCCVSWYPTFGTPSPLQRLCCIIGVALYLRVPVSYDRLYSTCVMVWTEGSETIKLAAFVLTVLLILIPFLITIVCNLGLLGYVLKLQQTGEKRPTTAFVTVFSICGLFTITNLPNMARILLPTFEVVPPDWLGVVNAHVYIINASCNAVILTVTNRRFRRFLLRRLCFRSISSPLSLLSSGGMNNNNHTAATAGPRSHVSKNNNDYELRQLQK